LPRVSLLGKRGGKRNRKENILLITEASNILSTNLIQYEKGRKFSWLGSAHATIGAVTPPRLHAALPLPLAKEGLIFVTKPYVQRMGTTVQNLQGTPV